MPPKKRLTSLNYLLIVESSSKCSKIESYLGDRYKCIASNGHIRTLEGLQSIDVKQNYAVTYIVDSDKKAHVDKMHAIVAEYPKENIIIASDHDREGEAIAWHICEVFDLPVATTRRIVFHEITKPAILAAVANPGIIDMNLVKAQQARQVLDMIVGFRVSPVLWKHLGTSNSLSAGRCQTPALRLIYENELEAKKALDSGAVKHRVQASFFDLQWSILFELDQTFSTYTDIEAFLTASQTHKHMLEIGKSRVSTRSPPKPFNTSSLLQSVGASMSAKDIMACCQTLYQMGHITYMRTESRKYSPVFTELAAKYITETWSQAHVNPVLSEIASGSEGSEGSEGPLDSEPLAHEAIRVTNINMRDLTIISSASNNMASVDRIYKIIWQNTVQSCMSNATFNCLPLSISAPSLQKDGKETFYKHTIETVKFAGFLDANNKKEQSDKKKIDAELVKVASSIVLQATANKLIPYNYIETIAGFTTHHSHYTEASLIDHLDKMNIGRPSTFSMLVDVIQTRKYVDKTDVAGVKHECREYRLEQGAATTYKSVEKMMGAEHNKLIIDPIGVVVIEFLLKHFSEFFSYDYTNAMEKRLDAVAAGSEVWHQVCADCDRELGKLIKITESDIKKMSYKVGEDFVLFFHKGGMLLRSNEKVNDKIVFKGIRRNVKVDMGKLERGEYTMSDLAEIDDIILGIRDDEPVYLKSGKYGYYIEFDKDKEDDRDDKDDRDDRDEKEPCRINVDKILKELGKTPDTVLLTDLAHLFEPSEKMKPSVRILTPELSIRTSKFGPYVFYKTDKMKKPKFFDLQKFEGDSMECDREDMLNWIKKTHKIKGA